MLGLSPLPRSLSAALEDLESQKAAVRGSAVRDLARHAEGAAAAPAVRALVRALRSDVSAEVRGAAALALADAAASDAADALVQATEDTHLHVRQMALLALGEVGAPEAAGPLDAVRRALDDEAPALRFQALIAFHRLGGAEAEPRLLSAIEDADDQVRHVALRLLEERATDDAGVARPSEPVVLAARRALRDTALGVRVAAAILLARAGDALGEPGVAEGVLHAARGVLDVEDEQTVIALAGELRIESARCALEQQAWGRFGMGQGRFAYEARIALARLGDPRARAAIVRGLDAWTRDARTLAVVAAGRSGIAEARDAIAAMRGDPRRAEPDAVAEALRALE